MKFKTNISKNQDGKHIIRGHDVIDLMGERSFAETIFLLLKGDFPNEKEKALLETVLVASVEHGIESPSVFVPRTVASIGNDFHTALAAGMLSIGKNHGGAGELAAKLLSSGKTAQEIVEENKIIPGFGHKIYKDEDPRATAIYSKAKELGFSCTSFDLAYEIEKVLEEKKGKKLPLNIDGAQAAALLEMGFDWRLGEAFFLMGRIVGMSAHVLEELDQKNSYHRLEDTDITE